MRLVATLLALACACATFSLPPFLETFKAKYGPLKGALAQASCQTCHTVPPQRHAFGIAVKEEMGRQQVRKLTEAVLTALEPADADGDGWPNGQEIRSGFLPGDPASHPEGEAPMKPTKAESSGGIVPKHAFHPLVVHFPVALFLFGAFLDVLGARRGDASLRRLALWNIGFGAAASLVAIGTGLAALLMNAYAFEGLPLWHMLLGIAASLCMIAAVMQKRKNPDVATVGYWATLAIGVAATAVGGHLGATLVFG